ncbi:MAG TPA: FIST N-terminal domain-containing protein [Pirellulales bacterium]|nr:FIST N-terminal domain-containing protein [Pirellulales bacterium]
MQTDLRFAAALSTAANTADAVNEVCHRAGDALASTPSLAMVFFSPHHAEHAALIAEAISGGLAAECLLGCTGESIVGNAQEIEGEPALALWLAALPGVSVQPMHVQFERTPEGGTVVGWPDDLPEPWPSGAALFALADPFTFPADWLLERLNEDRPGVPVLGGMASGGFRPGDHRLLLGRRVLKEGAVAALVHGPVKIQAVVSQGCRPIGRHYVITKAEQNIILELSGKPPLQQLQELFDTLPAADQQLAQQGLHVGRVINEYQERFERGDFLVRNCLGADRNTGALQIGDYVRAGQTVQFHVRDAGTADEDLRDLLSHARAAGDAQAALLFTCNGRGTRLFDAPHHDAAVLAESLGAVPAAGFFAQGEIGPIGGKNFLHGFTASAALFGPLVG